MAWFRVYDDLLDDPKVQRLSGDRFKILLNLWCITSKNGGRLPSIEDVAFKLRITPQQASSILSDLTKAGLIDRDAKGLVPHNWDARQYKSDLSTERVREHRKRARNVSDPPGNVSRNDTRVRVRTDSDSETETDSKSSAVPVAAREAYDALETALRKAAKVEDSPAPGLLNLAPIQGLIDAGYDLDRDILPVIRRKASGVRKLASWAYFIGSIQEAHGQRSQAASVPAKRKTSDPCDVDLETWRQRYAIWLRSKFWHNDWGTLPGYPGCEVPAEIIGKAPDASST